MKKALWMILALLFSFSPVLHAQGKTELWILGKNKGTVHSLQANGITLVDAQKTAKKLGGSVELFSAAKQIKIAFPGMYAILSAPLDEAIVNAASVKLPGEVVASGGKLYVPVQFFMLPQVQKALDRQITFENKALVVEKNFTLAYVNTEQKPSYTRLKLHTLGLPAPTAGQPNGYTVQAVFPGAVLKRNVSLRPKDSFVRSFSLTQRGKDAVLKIILGKKGKEWRLTPEQGELVFTAAARNLPAVSAAPAAQPAAQEAEELDLTPSVMAEEAARQPALSPAREQPVIKPAPTPVLSPSVPAVKEPHKMRIVIDPGHGGKDPGAVRRGSAKEKDLNLAVAKHLYNYLKKQGLEVRLTRDNDTFVTLAGRSKMANEFKADLFVSIHTNAAKRSAANGFEVYFRSDRATDKEAAEVAAFENEALQYEETHYSFVDKLLESLAKNEYMNESSKLAGHVRNYVYKEPGIGIAVRQNNSIRQANFYVLRGVKAPAILVEMGYASSPKDRARLNNKAAQKRMGEGIGKGIVSYAKAEGWLKK